LAIVVGYRTCVPTIKEGYMASLSHPHWETVTPVIRELLDFVGQQAFSERFYLAGGTALALQLGHRRSVDLDFFSESDEVTPTTQTEILAHLAPLQPAVVERAWGHFLLVIRQTQVGFFGYGYPLLRPTQQVAGLAVANPIDIGMMKLDALISRAARKDFFDLYFVTRTIPLDDLLAYGEQKYRHARDFEVEAVRSLAFFANADRDITPDLIEEVSWETVKSFFGAEAKRLGERWIDE
jgi:hypothetical protein